MKKILIIFLLIPSLSFGQLKQIYFGPRHQNSVWIFKDSILKIQGDTVAIIQSCLKEIKLKDSIIYKCLYKKK